MRLTIFALLSLLLTIPAAADLADCRYSAPHQLTAALHGATAVRIVGRAGSLRVNGANVPTITATGTACSSDRDFLGQMRIEARREGNEVVIEAVIPERRVLFGFHQARLDFEVTVPADMPLRIKDGSGSLRIRDVAAVEVVDGSGEIEIRGVRGAVQVHDGSGSMSIEDIGGDVQVTDGSGDIDIARVRGSVRIIADGSGSIDIRDVDQSVIVESDGSGSITVTDVRGDFIVENDGSGGIDYQRVRGTVRIPRR